MSTSTTALVPISTDESELLLRDHWFGRIAVVVGEQPLIFPVAYLWHQRCVVFRSIAGTKTAAFDRPVSFEIDGVDARYHGGWSVLVIGRADEVSDAATIAEFERLRLPHWVEIDDPVWVRIRPSAITGRRIEPRS